MKRTYIRRAAELVTCSGDKAKHGSEMKEVGIIQNGAVLIEDGHIALVGSTEELDKKVDFQTAELIDAGGQAVLPGFVDSHTHFLFGGYRADEFGWRLQGESYLSIMEKGGGINATVTPTRAASVEDFVAVGKERLDTMLRFGVTTVEGKSGYGMDKDTELRMLRAMKILDESHPVDVVRTFLGPHSVLPEWKGKEREFLRYMLTEVMPEVKKEDLAEFADIFTETGVFNIEDSTWYLQEAKKLGFRLKVHADEIAPDFGGAEMAVGCGAHSADHLLKASDEGIRRLAEGNTIATLLPLTAFCLKEPYAPARKMIDAGCAVALASDLNPGSCFSNSIPLLIALGCIYMNMRIEEVVTALTLNGAAAVGREKEIGSIDPGKQADLIFLRYPSIQFLPYRTGVNIVSRVMKRGELVI
ncbi:imidazolonepropionase [Stomatobaculum longum]